MLTWVLSAAAAPSVAPPDADTLADPTSAETKSPSLGESGLADLGDQSRTIKLLLELQATPEAAPKVETPARSAAASKASPAKVVENPFADADGPFGAPTVVGDSPAATTLQSPDWQGGLGAPVVSGTATPPGYEPYAAPRSGGDSRPSGARSINLLPPEWLRWLRDHRYEIIGGAVVLLLLVSGGAVLQSQRPR